MPAPRRTLEERFWEKVDKNGPVMPGMDTPCWVWTAAKSAHGYGQIGVDGKVSYANRVVWEMTFGPLQQRECALHRCDNPPCVRPDHLFRGTQKDNAVDRERKGRGNHPSSWKKDPASVIRGDAHHMRRCPDKRYFGESNKKAKLTKELVLQIRARFDLEKGRHADIGKMYGVNASTIGRILRREIWSHI